MHSDQRIGLLYHGNDFDVANLDFSIAFDKVLQDRAVD